MKETTGDLWEQRADAICITTNGHVTSKGLCVMGRGCALEALARFGTPIAQELGDLITTGGNHAYLLFTAKHTWHDPEHDVDERVEVISFPVKHHWKEQADLTLIKRSAEEVVNIADMYGLTNIVIPRPGCGNGRLTWKQVKPVLKPILDDRFTIITF